MSEFVPKKMEELLLEWPPELDHISASSVKMAVRCPEQWRQRYVLGRKQPPAAALIYGRADHRAIEHSMRQKIVSYTDSPISEVRDLFVATVDSEIESDGGYGELEVRDPKSKELVKEVWKKKQIVGSDKKAGSDLVAQYQNQVSPELQPTEIEQHFELETRLPVKITGYVDLIGSWIAFDGGPGPSRIIDRKRVGRTGIQPEWRLQAEVYQIAKPLPFEWHLSNHSGGGRIIVPDAKNPDLSQPSPDPERALRFLEQIIAEVGFLYRKYGPDEGWPTKGKLHPFACNYCGYRPDCWGWK